MNGRNESHKNFKILQGLFLGGLDWVGDPLQNQKAR
jgi:hypothetical protein